MSKSQNLYFRNCRKHGFSANLNQFWLSIAEDDKKINNIVIMGNISTINSKTKWIKNLNPKVKAKVTKSLFSKMKKNGDC